MCPFVVALALAGLPMHVDAAAAATTEIGAIKEIEAGDQPSPITDGGFAVQVAEASGTYAVPQGYDTITAWRHSAGTISGFLTFKVLRPTGTPKEFIAVASDTRSVVAGTVPSFAVQIPVQPGDRIGLSTADVQIAFESLSSFDRIGFFSIDPPDGTTRATDGDPFPDFKLDVAATLTSPPGVEVPPPPAPYDLPTAAPVLRRLTVVPNAFSAARRGASTRSSRVRGSGTRVAYSADVAAAVRFVVQRVATGRRARTGGTARCVAQTPRNRRAARCMRYVSIAGTFTHAARAGANSFYFTGRVGGRALAPASYRLVATPTAGGVAGSPVSTRLRIIRRGR